MSTIVHNHWTRLADRVLAYYVQHPELLEKLLQRLGVETVEHRWGHDLRCACPLHGGQKKQNFRLWYHQGIPRWRCFSDACGSGDLVKLLQIKYRSSYSRAVVALGRLAGLQMDGASMEISPQQLQEEDIHAFRRRLGLHVVDDAPNTFPEEMNSRAMSFLYRERNRPVVEYLTGTGHSPWGRQRNYTVEALRHFEAGYVPGGAWTCNDANGDPHGWYVNRISVPWRDVDGQLIGFAGRRIDGVKDKKWQTLYGTKKGVTWYGLHYPLCQQRIIETGEVNIVEGYQDVWRAWVHGYPNTISPGGTELTDVQMGLLWRFPLRKSRLLMDGDGPGAVATNTIGRQLQRFFSVERSVLPSGVDPDDLWDGDSFRRLIHSSMPFLAKEK